MIKVRKGQVSIEFLLSLFILLIILALFIKTNIYFKNKLEEGINYNQYNEEVCSLKEVYLNQKEGKLIGDFCVTKRASNDS